MIFFFAPGGRLGNILFQYAYLLKVRKPNERIFTTQLKKIHTLLDGVRRVYNSNNRLLVRAVDWFIQPFFEKILVPFKLVSSYIENENEVSYKKGIFPFTFIKGYFQSGNAIQDSTNIFSIKESFLQFARNMLKSSESRVPVFLHVRRGDYKTWQFDGIHTSCLPEEFYKKAIDKLYKDSECNSLHFFIVGDDPDWCESVFLNLKFKTICRQSPEKDLALMSLCHGGIISNSSFAWWGWALCKKTVTALGPLYWLGWKSHKWYPSENIKTSEIRYLSVD